MKVNYIIPLSYQLPSRNFKMELYYFQERLSLSDDTIQKLLSSFHSKITNFQKDLLFKEQS